MNFYKNPANQRISDQEVQGVEGKVIPGIREFHSSASSTRKNEVQIFREILLEEKDCVLFCILSIKVPQLAM